MKIKDRYIAKTLLTYSLVVMLVWLSIYGFFNFLAELNNVGTSDYTILEALKYIILQMPEVAYDQISPVILLGCVLGMGHLATTGQLVILRAAGLSILNIALLTLKNALIFLIFLIVIGETVSPILTEYAENERSIALGQNSLSRSQDGFWIRDGNNFINVENNIDGNLFNGITVIEVNQSNEIKRVIRSDYAIFDGNSLKMECPGNILECSSSKIFSIDDSNLLNNISLKERNSYNKKVSFNEDLIDSLEKEPRDLRTLTIINQIQFLKDNQLRADVFEVELYKRLAKPLTLIAMILLAMLFIFGSTRDSTLGRKIFFGMSIGLSFELISRIGGALALSFDFSPILSSFLPALVIMVVAVLLLMKKSIY